MLRDNRFRLITLGRLTLVGAGGEEDASLARRRLKLAVLAVLALARRPLSRDTLLGLFWAEHDEPRARHSLSNALSSLRGALGERSITTRDAEVALDPETPLDVDAIEFAEAIEGRDVARAVELYAGPFLEGFHVDESPAFEQWISRERRRLEAMFLKACAEHCAALARSRRWAECEAVAHRWLDTEPLSADAAIYFLNAIKSPGTRAALAQALEEYEALRTRLNREFELAPHPSVVELSGRIRDQLANAPPEPVVHVRVTAETKIEPLPAAAPTPAPSVPPARPEILTGAPAKKRRWPRAALVAAGVTVVALVTLLLRPRSQPVVTRPVIAVLSLPMQSTDSSAVWLSDGLPQMIDTKLANVSAIEIVPAGRVHALMIRSGRAADARLPDDAALDLARRVGATHVAHGTLARDAGNFVLDLSVHDVRNAALVRNVVLSHADPLALADQAAARILSAANVSLGGPRLMDIETASLEAYQLFMRAQEHAQAGRQSAAVRDIDASIALDSGFIPALRARLSMAISGLDTALTRRLRLVIQRHADRASQFDRSEQELWDSYETGEHERSAALARALVRRYPRDPRAYAMLESLLLSQGLFKEAEQVAIAGLALDSLTMRAGSGPCSQCKGFSSVIYMRWLEGDYRGAASWARRWITEQPDAASAGSYLAWTFAYSGQIDSGLTVMRRAVTLSGNELWTLDQYARMLLIGRRYTEADSVIGRIEAIHGEGALGQSADLRALLARERGKPREALRIVGSLVGKSLQATYGSDIVTADNHRLLGDYVGAAKIYERITHGPGTPPTVPSQPGAARAFCWHHALAADALGLTGDTLGLRAVADTLAGCGRSNYARDWRLQHHVRGLIAMRGGRFAEAEREFSAAVWTTVEGWSRTAVELAKARMALGKPAEALAALRTAYATRLDAMGRYVPISELDYWMAMAFARAGQADSARVYQAYHARAWADADPDARRQLATSSEVLRGR